MRPRTLAGSAADRRKVASRGAPSPNGRHVSACRGALVLSAGFRWDPLGSTALCQAWMRTFRLWEYLSGGSGHVYR